MSRKGWKQVERDAAALFGGKRFPANMGGPLDFETEHFVGQVKNLKQLPLAALEALALEIAGHGHYRKKVGVLVVKRSAGPGRYTPSLVIFTDAAWRATWGVNVSDLSEVSRALLERSLV